VMATHVLGELGLAIVPDASPPGASEAYRARARATVAITGTRAGWLDYIRNPTRRSELAAAHPSIAAPTLVLHGTRDSFVPDAAMRRTAPRIPQVEIIELEGGGHFPHRDDPEGYVARVTAFLAGP